MSTAARYHPGESAAHDLAGLADQAERSRLAIGDTFPAAAVEFLAAQPMVVLGAADSDGRVWASLLTGQPGFLTVTGDRNLRVRSRPAADDPLRPVLQAPAHVGLLALEPGSRRRMRVNGRCQPIAEGLSVTAHQVYANCPKYISQRRPVALEQLSATPATSSASLTEAQRRLIQTADTFFIATHSAGGAADASHRGGNPGFVTVHDGATLSWPDYTGNAMMMTLGNLLQEPSAGLLFLDWATGSTLQLTGPPAPTGNSAPLRRVSSAECSSPSPASSSSAR